MCVLIERRYGVVSSFLECRSHFYFGKNAKVFFTKSYLFVTLSLLWYFMQTTFGVILHGKLSGMTTRTVDIGSWNVGVLIKGACRQHRHRMKRQAVDSLVNPLLSCSE